MSDDLNLNNIPSFDDLAKEFGVEDLGPIQGTTQFYQHSAGELHCLVGRLEIKYKDLEGKSCDKTKPGAVRSHGIQQLIVYKDPTGNVINTETWEPDPNSPYGRLVYSQYIPLDGENQWKNRAFYETFKIDGMPQCDIVQGGKNDFTIHLNNAVYFIGMPVRLTLEPGKKENSVFVKEALLQTHNLTRDMLIKRKGLMDSLYAKLEAKLEHDRALREAKKASSTTLPPAEEPDDVNKLTKDWM